ncbi:hypothetical protein GCK32_007873 [Trichostrongylus colubriformis]|uniref:Uncharacterized protein n=1 Tax=Trichostrongylus colubriformis TaxID=6319 RepID=A0AAN8FUG4_TRICO
MTCGCTVHKRSNNEILIPAPLLLQFCIFLGSVTAAWCFVLLTQPQSLLTLNCLHGPSDNTVQKAGGNVCVMYEVDSCSAPRRYYDSFNIPNLIVLQGFCAVFKDNNNADIAACFCQEEYCNRKETVMSLLGPATTIPLTVPIMSTWKFEPDVEHTKTILKCLRKNMYASDTDEEETEDSKSRNIQIRFDGWTIAITILLVTRTLEFMKVSQRKEIQSLVNA